MNIKGRVLTCRLLENMKKQERYSKAIGLEDVSRYYGNPDKFPSSENKKTA